jgi:hypothetical protein
MTRASGLTATAAQNSISSSGWPQSSQIDTSKYYTLALTPPSGCTLDITSLAVDAKTSGTGPAGGSAATSVDSFAGMSAVQTNAISSPAMTVSGATGQVEIRIYGFGATSASGTFRIENTFTVTGSLQ